MPGHNIVVIGREDAVFGLGLIGLRGYPVASIDEARRSIRKAMTDPDVALILLTEDFSQARPETRADASDDGGALIVEIPSPGVVAPSVALESRIEQALGVRLEQ